MEILGTKRFIPKGFELGTTLRNKYTKKGDLNNSDFIPDLSRFSHYKK